MSGITLAVMAFLLLVAQSGLVDSPACGMNGLVRSTRIAAADPCPGAHNEQPDSSSSVKIHACDCGALILPDYPVEAAVILLFFTFFLFLLRPFTVAPKPPAPPPRFAQ